MHSLQHQAAEAAWIPFVLKNNDGAYVRAGNRRIEIRINAASNIHKNMYLKFTPLN
jgi:hypothetical protein